MHQVTHPETGPKLKLIEAAERLFAERGFDVVSVRDITGASKSNVAAINYHFGSRDGLIATVAGRHLGPINRECLARFDELETRHPHGAPVEDVFAALVVSWLERRSESPLPETLYCKLIGRLYGLNGALSPELHGQCAALTARLAVLLEKSLPGVPPGEIPWRVHFAVGGVLHTLVHAGGPNAPDLATTLDQLIRFAAAGLRGENTPHAAPVESRLATPPQSGPEPEEEPVPETIIEPVPIRPVLEESEPAPRRKRESAAESPQGFFDF